MLPGETLGLVGESGCGKSTLGRCVIRLHDPTGGKIDLRRPGHLARSRAGELRPLRREMQMIFQDPYASLNPRKRVGQIIGDPLTIHGQGDREAIKAKVQELLELVGLNPEHYNRYPHEFSGGQRQRIGVARALALNPQLIVADEPVSALDVSIQAQVVNLLDDLQDELGLTYLFIAHDLVGGAARVRPHRRHVPRQDRRDLARRGALPATRSTPTPRRCSRRCRSRTSRSPPSASGSCSPGDVPSPINPPSGCRFHPRCRYATEICTAEEPQLDRPRRRTRGGLPPPAQPDPGCDRFGAPTAS